jgi:hypothetical protein
MDLTLGENAGIQTVSDLIHIFRQKIKSEVAACTLYNIRLSKKDYALLFFNLSSFLWKDYAGAPICKGLSSPRIDSTRLCILAGRYDKYDKSIPWNRFQGS